jgi:hypothetical protein
MLSIFTTMYDNDLYTFKEASHAGATRRFALGSTGPRSVCGFSSPWYHVRGVFTCWRGDDRKTGILFWKSMPASDLLTFVKSLPRWCWQMFWIALCDPLSALIASVMVMLAKTWTLFRIVLPFKAWVMVLGVIWRAHLFLPFFAGCCWCRLLPSCSACASVVSPY